MNIPTKEDLINLEALFNLMARKNVTQLVVGDCSVVLNPSFNSFQEGIRDIPEPPAEITPAEQAELDILIRRNQEKHLEDVNFLNSYKDIPDTDEDAYAFVNEEYPEGRPTVLIANEKVSVPFPNDPTNPTNPIVD